MAASTFGAAGVIALILLAFGVINPIIVPLILILAALPLVLRGALGLFKHAGGSPGRETSPAVPTTSQAAYDPVERP